MSLQLNGDIPIGGKIVQLQGGTYGVVLDRDEPSSYGQTRQVAHLQTYLSAEDESDVSTQTVHTTNLSLVTHVDTISEDVWGGEAPDEETLETLTHLAADVGQEASGGYDQTA